MSDNKNELEYNDIEEIEDLNDAVGDINGQKENNEDKKSNISENRYEDSEKRTIKIMKTIYLRYIKTTKLK